MSGAPRVSSMNVAESEVRPVLGPAGNKAVRSATAQKLTSMLLKKVEKSSKDVVKEEGKHVCSCSEEVEEARAPASSPSLQHSTSLPSVFRRQEQLLHLNSSMNASCSSDASTESFHSRASTGRINRKSSVGIRKKQFSLKPKVDVSDESLDCLPDGSLAKRCAWVTANTDPIYAAFHDEEWGVPVHDDKKLFELLVLSGALAELTWPAILSKRHMFREVFVDFDPIAVSKLSEKKIIALGRTASPLLSQLKLRSIIENAKQVTKVIDEFGSFENYIWSFVNYKPIVSKFRYPRQVPVKTPKADVISKDLVRRGFRSVGQTVIYSFMQAAGLTNDHLISCFRFHECVTATEPRITLNGNSEDKKPVDVMIESGLSRAIDELSLCSE